MRWRAADVSVVVDVGVKVGRMGEMSVLSMVDMVVAWGRVGEGGQVVNASDATSVVKRGALWWVGYCCRKVRYLSHTNRAAHLARLNNPNAWQDYLSVMED